MLAMHATYGDALLRAHRALMTDLRQLRETAFGAGDDRPAEVASHLDGLRGVLREHFQLEEEDGYMGAVLTLHPHLDRMVEHLHGQHRELLGGLGSLLAEARAAPALTAQLRAKVEAWVGQVRRHERSENLLIQDAFNLDLAAED
jgi:hypothetical protein